jgi:hypothetical protein
MREMSVAEFEQCVLISVGQLARLADVPNNRTMIRWLRGAGVNVLRSGRRHMVERVSLKEKLPGVYKGLLSKLPGADED